MTLVWNSGTVYGNFVLQKKETALKLFKPIWIASAKDILVEVSEIQVVPDFDDPSVFETNFIQSYKASHYREVSRKVLTWQVDDKGRWKIVKEENLPVDTVEKESNSPKLALARQLSYQ